MGKCENTTYRIQIAMANMKIQNLHIISELLMYNNINHQNEPHFSHISWTITLIPAEGHRFMWPVAGKGDFYK